MPIPTSPIEKGDRVIIESKVMARSLPICILIKGTGKQRKSIKILARTVHWAGLAYPIISVSNEY